MKNKTTGSSATASSPKRGSVIEINHTTVQEFRESKRAFRQTDAPEEDMMTAIERTRKAAIGVELMKVFQSL